MDLHLKDSICLVTGGSQGIGLATALTLHAEGARVAAVSRSVSGLAGHLDDRLVHVAADLASPDGPAAAVAATVERFGGLDVVVNNAGGPPPGVTMPRFGFAALSDADWTATLDFNLLSAVRTVRAALPHLLARGGGSVVNVSSTNATVPSAVNVDYGAAKAALANLTQALSEELGPQGVRVNTVSPGPVRTPWWTREGGAADVLAAATGSTREAVLDGEAAAMMSLTTGRLVDPQEVADAIVLLASPRSASTTGSDVVVDGGLRKAV
jgi:NAD(P)-dependent dehydrogenase (short-subunit alcohol dehydrogenase family)